MTPVGALDITELVEDEACYLVCNLIQKVEDGKYLVNGIVCYEESKDAINSVNEYLANMEDDICELEALDDLEVDPLVFAVNKIDLRRPPEDDSSYGIFVKTQGSEFIFHYYSCDGSEDLCETVERIIATTHTSFDKLIGVRMSEIGLTLQVPVDLNEEEVLAEVR